MAIVYNHKRNDTGEVFYVGIGKTKSRVHSKFNRNAYWHNVVNKHGYTAEITHSNVIWEEACAIERYLIAFYGRADLGLGSLCNLTDGGEGTYGHKVSDEARKKISESNKGKIAYNKGVAMSEEQKKKVSESKKGSTPWNKGLKNVMIPWNKGKKLSEDHVAKLKKSWKKRTISPETREKMNLAHSKRAGTKCISSMKKVINVDTNEIYESTIEAAQKNNINLNYLRCMLRGNRTNKTNLKYL